MLARIGTVLDVSDYVQAHAGGSAAYLRSACVARLCIAKQRSYITCSASCAMCTPNKRSGGHRAASALDRGLVGSAANATRGFGLNTHNSRYTMQRNRGLREKVKLTADRGDHPCVCSVEAKTTKAYGFGYAIIIRCGNYITQLHHQHSVPLFLSDA